MAVGAGITAQARLRPVRSAIGAAGAVGNGVGINFGMGIGAVRVAGVTYAVWDASETYDMATLSFVARIVVINGDYPFSAQNFTIGTDLSNWDTLYDVLISNAGPEMLPTWMAGMVTDNGANVTAMVSQLVFPAGGPPPGITPQTFFVLHGDNYKSRELALSPGSIEAGL